MSDIEEKGNVKDTALIEIKKPRVLAKKKIENKKLKAIIRVLLKILKFIIKLTIIIAVYAVVFWGALYISNKFIVQKLRETEKDKTNGPVLTIIRRKEEKEDKKEEKKRR